MLLPVGGRALRVVPVQCSLIVLTVVSENCAAGFEPAFIPDQQIPVMMSHFTAEVAEQCAIGLVHLASIATYDRAPDRLL
jgi:hypothetical protein